VADATAPLRVHGRDRRSRLVVEDAKQRAPAHLIDLHHGEEPPERRRCGEEVADDLEQNGARLPP
jgi:hypothetical protein